MRRPDTGQNIALGVTLLVLLLLLLLLCGVHMHLDGPARKPASEELAMADIEPEELQEEMFIEPILQDAGEENVVEKSSEDAPMPQGEPEQAVVPNEKLVVNGPNPNKNDESEPIVAAKKPSPVKTTAPSQKDEPDQKIASSMKGQFSPHNGKPEGKGSTASSGKGGTGSGVSGSMGNGRKLEHYELPSNFQINQKTVIRVSVEVRADGTVQSAHCSRTDHLGKLCETYSKRTRWTPKKGAPVAKGTITWTLMPKI